MNVDEIALRVADRLEPRGRTYSPDHYVNVVKLVLEELGRNAEPVGHVATAMRTGEFEMTTPTREQVVQCKGENCNSTDGTNHSVECLFEHFVSYRGLNPYEQRVRGDIKAAYFDGYDSARADLESTIAEQATEISKLIAAVADHVTVRAEQRQTITEQAAEIERMKHSEAVMKAYYEQIFQDGGKRIVELRQQLAAEQAYAEQLREELDRLCSVLNDSGYTTERSRKIIAIPHDTNALQEYGAKLLDRVIDSINSEYHRPLAHIPDKIRKGEF